MDSGQQAQPLLPRTATKDSSPTPSPPALDTLQSDVKLTALGKREREISVEPTTPSAEIDIPRDRKDSTRTPARKNRRYLSTTLEEDGDALGTRSRSTSVSPPLGVSPPGEMKMRVRQISQGVEDLSWRPNLPTHEQKDEEMQEEEENQGAVSDREENLDADKDDAAVTEPATPKDAPSPADVQMSKSFPNTASAQETGPAGQQDAMGDSDMTGQSSSASRLHAPSDGADKDKTALKRKHSERGTSQAPPEADEPHKKDGTAGEGLKRPRDDAAGDDNPRETKRPTPPPENKSGRTSPPSPKVPKLGGFMAYASTSSPFAHVKGQNLFASSKSAPLLPSPSSTPLGTPVLGQEPKLGESSMQAGSGFGAFAGTSSPFASVTRSKTPSGRSGSPPKRTGLEAFGSAASPFASVTRTKSPVSRSKSPPRTTNAFATSSFASYATAASPFAAVSKASASTSSDRQSTASIFGQKNENSDEGEEEGKHASFGERLRAGKDDQEEHEDEAKVALTEQEVMTGEEDEETVIQVRGKLFALQDGNQWKERGTGIIKLNVKRQDGSNPRLVMRKDAVYTLLLNVTLFPGMRCVLAQDPRYLRFSVIEGNKTTHYNLRVANAKIAQEFLDEIHGHIPLQ